MLKEHKDLVQFQESAPDKIQSKLNKKQNYHKYTAIMTGARVSQTKVLFILKRRPDFNPEKHTVKGLSTGLFNSATFVANMLSDAGIDSCLEVAIDNNCIDRLVRQHQPTHVIIEALWVVPTKFEVLIELHPGVRWIIRLHSEMPFIASEGISMDWIGDYVTYPEIDIAINAPRLLDEISEYLSTKMGWATDQCCQRVFYLPNFYPQQYQRKKFDRDKYWIDISCFGAIRPLKNHLLQAFAALKLARRIRKQLRFHINLGRIEMKGDPIHNNITALFEQLNDYGHQLIGHEWTPREEFLEICGQMDIGMQCNFSETFNIVSADLISQGVPVLGSKEIPWSSWIGNADPTNSEQMAQRMYQIYLMPQLNVAVNQWNLTRYTDETRQIWINYFGEKNEKKVSGKKLHLGQWNFEKREPSI